MWRTARFTGGLSAREARMVRSAFVPAVRNERRARIAVNSTTWRSLFLDQSCGRIYTLARYV
jgi:hypothetical protein